MNYHLLISVLENYCLYFPDPTMPLIGGGGIIGDSSSVYIRKEIWDMYELTASSSMNHTKEIRLLHLYYGICTLDLKTLRY